LLNQISYQLKQISHPFFIGVSKSSANKGCLCRESERAKIHFRNSRVMALPPGITGDEPTAPVVKKPVTVESSEFC